MGLAKKEPIQFSCETYTNAAVDSAYRISKKCFTFVRLSISKHSSRRTRGLYEVPRRVSTISLVIAAVNLTRMYVGHVSIPTQVPR